MFAAWVVSLITLALCTAFFVASFSIKLMPGADPGGPALYPRTVIAITTAALLVLFVRLARDTDFRRGFVRSKELLTAPWTGARGEIDDVRRVAFVIILSAVYPLVMLKIGFVLSTAVFGFILM